MFLLLHLFLILVVVLLILVGLGGLLILVLVVVILVLVVVVLLILEGGTVVFVIHHILVKLKIQKKIIRLQLLYKKLLGVVLEGKE